MTITAADGHEIQLALEPELFLVRAVRLVTAGLAADIGFSLRELDDLALAVDELTVALFDVAKTEVTLHIRVDGAGITVRGAAEAGQGPIELSELATSILARTCDGHEVGGPGAAPSFSMWKSRESND